MAKSPADGHILMIGINGPAAINYSELEPLIIHACLGKEQMR
jgi:hypothetical protein